MRKKFILFTIFLTVLGSIASIDTQTNTTSVYSKANNNIAGTMSKVELKALINKRKYKLNKLENCKKLESTQIKNRFYSLFAKSVFGGCIKNFVENKFSLHLILSIGMIATAVPEIYATINSALKSIKYNGKIVKIERKIYNTKMLLEDFVDPESISQPDIKKK